MTTVFANIALVLTLTAVLAAIFNRFRQPIVLAYLLAGILAASSGAFKEITTGSTLNLLAELGIAFALFLIGLELKFSEIRQIGRASVFVGLGQVVFTALVGYLLIRGTAIASGQAIFLAVALTFSSTIIVIKLLEQKRDLDSLYGKITTGYLIVQDFVAIAALIFLASIGKGESSGEFLLTGVKGLFLVGLILILNRYILQNLFDSLAKNTEVLFLASIAWALIFAAVSAAFGFSIEIGAFLAGLGLATLREEAQIASWIRPLRNLFITIFFLSLGLKLSIGTIYSIFWPVAILSAFVLIGNPAIMMILMGILGFRRRTSFHVAVTSAQVSEFSLIFVVVGNRLGVVTDRSVNLIAATALVTIVLSTYLINYSSKLYRLLSPALRVFERKNLSEKLMREEKEFSDHVVLVGDGRLGQNILKALIKKNLPVVVVDFDPSVVKKLQEQDVSVIYGDISDPEIFEKAIGKNVKMIISTVFDAEDTNAILAASQGSGRKVPVIVTSPLPGAALDYYKKGASYVIVPRVLSSHLIERYLLSDKFEDLQKGNLRADHIEELRHLQPNNV